MQKKVYLFIDTSIYVETGFNFMNGKLLSVLKYCRAGVVQLLVDSIVVNEVSNRICNDLDQAFSQVNNKLKDCHLNGLRQAGNLELIDSNKMISLALESWEQYRNASKAMLLDSDNIHIDDVMADYFKSAPPFESKKEKKNEFPDAIIIRKIKRFAEQSVESNNIYIVTKDKGWEKAFDGFSSVIFINSLESALEKISLSKNGDIFNGVKEMLPFLYKEMEDYIEESLISNQELAIDLDFEDVEEVYFKKLEIDNFKLEYIDENSVVCSVSYLANIVLDYDSFYFSHENGYFYSHDLHRELHLVRIELNISLEYVNRKVKNKCITNIPTVSEQTLIKKLPHYCSECEARLCSENETEEDMCKDCVSAAS